MSKKYVVISGGFDPIHSGHINLIQNAAELGNLLVIVNNDNFLRNKKGFIFMNNSERIRVISSIKGVDETFLSIDEDHTVRESLKYLLKKGFDIKYFANGGDRNLPEDIPEFKVCRNNNIELIFDVGGSKTQSSSKLANSLYDQMLLNEDNTNIYEKPWGFYKTFISDGDYLLKKIFINPNEEISEQSHNFRDEHWIVVAGEVEILAGDKKYTKTKNQHIFIDKKLRHKITNNHDVPAIIIEIQTGVILSESDIIRYKDKYNRK